MEPRPDRPRASRAVVHAREGMVAAAQPLAVQAGVAVLREGGSAVDAAIACNAVLAVVEPVACGLGGDLFALLWDPADRKLVGLDASGRAPRSAAIDRVRPQADGTISLRSPDSWTVPGAVDGWFALHGRYGRLSTARILEDAIRIAQDGFPVSEVVASAWRAGASANADQPGFAEVFLVAGKPPAEGEVFRNPSLARTLRQLVDGGRDAFYRGEIVKNLVAFSEANGGRFAPEDLEATRSTWVEPVHVTFAGHELWELPPAGQGLAALQLLNIAEARGIEALRRDEADWWHLLVEAKKLAFADRARYYADPEASRVPVAELLSKTYAQERAQQIDMGRAAMEATPGLPRLDHTETTYLAAADSSGLMVSLIQSNYTGFGSGHAVPSLGFGLQNRGGLFSLDPAHPNALAPGKRPFHTIIPGFVTRAGEPWLAFGVMGGDMQPQGHVQVLLNLLAGMNLQEAGDAPRFHHGGSSEPTGTVMRDGGMLHLEPEVPRAVADELTRHGHRVSDRPFAYGGYQAVARDAATGCFLGATERRKDGCALGW